MAGTCHIGVIGLAVMGENLALNIESRGFSVALYNRTTSKIDDLLAGRGKGKQFTGCNSLEGFVKALATPRKILMMVKAGQPVDDLMNQLQPHLEPGDILIDGGNSHFADTRRRCDWAAANKLLFVGSGISGGEEGALHGPSLMPGGDEAAWPHLKLIFQAISAKVGSHRDIPCCAWMGPDGAGHYVKMVHNGIEYGDMQLICEAYHLLKVAAGLTNEQLADTFDAWNKTDLESYLIEITRDIFTVREEGDERDLVDLVVDAAAQKGTGKWMSQHALDLGVPTTLITEAVFARTLSSQRAERVNASKVLKGLEDADAKPPISMSREELIDSVRHALYASKICSYAQGFVQLRAAAKEFGWSLKYGEIARIWRGGCIIRARFLDRISDAYASSPELENLLLDPYFRNAITEAQHAWRVVVATGAMLGIPLPAFSSALSYFDGVRSEWLPANLMQAQRDYFGAHTYKRLDQDGVFHTDWLSARKINK